VTAPWSGGPERAALLLGSVDGEEDTWIPDPAHPSPARLREARLPRSEAGSIGDTPAPSRRALPDGLRHLPVLHSVAFRPGLSPWTSMAKDVEHLDATNERNDGLSRRISVRFATVGEPRITSGFAELTPRLRGRSAVVHA
jgi:hypothetical protein